MQQAIYIAQQAAPALGRRHLEHDDGVLRRVRDDQEAAENFLGGRRDDLTRGSRDERMPQTPLSVLAMETPPLTESDGEGDDLEHDFHTEPSDVLDGARGLAGSV